MGTASFTVGKYAVSKGAGAATTMATTVVTSGAHTTSTTASNVEDAGGDITLAVGHVIRIHADEAMRVAFGGTAATASTGHFIASGTEKDWECTEPGVVSIIDVA